VRVFEQGSLGKGTVDVTGAFIGGSKKMNINNELYIPVPGADKDKSLRLFAFLDAGNVWSDRASTSTSDHAARVGRPGPELDVAGGPVQAELRRSDACRAKR
jgi:outer membrane protein insertion porin family